MKSQKIILGMMALAIFGSFFAHAAYAANTVVATIPVGTQPIGVAYDSAKGEIFVTNDGSDNVSVIRDLTIP
ncbi:MAG: YncE family protein [Nitrosotalea sp.]